MNAPNGATRPSVILLVDDDAVVRYMAREALEDGGFVVVETDDGASAVEMLAEVRPSVVMLDIVMPGMDGFAACTAIRASAVGAHIPVVMMTGLDDDESINRAFEAGATTFITKRSTPRSWSIGCATSSAPRGSRTSCARARLASPRRREWRGSATGTGTWQRT